MKKTGLRWGYVVALFLIIVGSKAESQEWSLRVRGTVLEIFYGTGGNTPQYAALHLDSSYFRMNYGPQSGWGTSVILMPAFWSRGVYYQGAPVSWSYRLEGYDLVLLLSGTIASLQVNLQVRLLPPRPNEFIALVNASLTGSISLDNRPGEAFKPVMLSSMRVSQTSWDTQRAYAECASYSIPTSGWINYPPASGRFFGLLGGTSAWKPNAPTIEVLLAEPLQVTGWVTYSTNPNDDNVGFWAASNTLMRSWSYLLRAAPSRTFLLSGRVVLEQYQGNITTQPITVELRPASSTIPLRTETFFLQAGGHYMLYLVAPGTYDVALRGTHWLRRVVPNVRVNNECVFGLDASLINGDIDGDNEVTLFDFGRLVAAFGSFPGGANWNPNADLDGDNEVTLLDFGVLVSNFAMMGDP